MCRRPSTGSGVVDRAAGWTVRFLLWPMVPVVEASAGTTWAAYVFPRTTRRSNIMFAEYMAYDGKDGPVRRGVGQAAKNGPRISHRVLFRLPVLALATGASLGGPRLGSMGVHSLSHSGGNHASPRLVSGEKGCLPPGGGGGGSSCVRLPAEENGGNKSTIDLSQNMSQFSIVTTHASASKMSKDHQGLTPLRPNTQGRGLGQSITYPHIDLETSYQ